MPSTGCAQEKVWPGEPVHNGRELSTLGISRATSHVSFRPPFLQVPPSGQTARPARHMRRGRDAARADRLRQTVRARRDRANRRPRARRPGHGDRANRRARARRPGAPRPREQSAPGTATRARRPGHGDPGTATPGEGRRRGAGKRRLTDERRWGSLRFGHVFDHRRIACQDLPRYRGAGRLPARRERRGATARREQQCREVEPTGRAWREACRGAEGRRAGWSDGPPGCDMANGCRRRSRAGETGSRLSRRNGR